MKTKLLLFASAALALSAPLARAQDWEGGGGGWRELREDCENGDEGACHRLRHMRREHEEREGGGWREHDGGGYGGGRAPGVDPKVATCAAIETNYNNCVRQQRGNSAACAAWVVELKANRCF